MLLTPSVRNAWNSALNRLELGMHQMQKNYHVNVRKQQVFWDRSDLHLPDACWQLSMQCMIL